MRLHREECQGKAAKFFAEKIFWKIFEKVRDNRPFFESYFIEGVFSDLSKRLSRSGDVLRRRIDEERKKVHDRKRSIRL